MLLGFSAHQATQIDTIVLIMISPHTRAAMRFAKIIFGSLAISHSFRNATYNVVDVVATQYLQKFVMDYFI